MPITAVPDPAAAVADGLLEELPLVVDVVGVRSAERPHVVLVVPTVQPVDGLVAGLLVAIRRCGTRACTRQFLRSTTWPCSAAASSAKLHWVGSAWIPSVEFEAIDSTPMPYLPASVIPDGEIDDAVKHELNEVQAIKDNDLLVNNLGSCFGSTGPMTIDPSSGRPDHEFPRGDGGRLGAQPGQAGRCAGHDAAVMGGSLGACRRWPDSRRRFRSVGRTSNTRMS